MATNNNFGLIYGCQTGAKRREYLTGLVDFNNVEYIGKHAFEESFEYGHSYIYTFKIMFLLAFGRFIIQKSHLKMIWFTILNNSINLMKMKKNRQVMISTNQTD